MRDMEIGGIAVLALLAVMGPFVGWVIWCSLPERVRLVDGLIVRAERGRRESVPLAEIDCIRFHYHAVVGFISSWEFVAKDGSSLDVSGEAKGLAQVLTQLAEILPGFSTMEFRTQFEAGDVEDTIDVWRRHA